MARQYKYQTREELLGLPRPDYTTPRPVYLRDLRDATLKLRQYATGFESRDGFNLKTIESWPNWRKGLVTKYIRQMQALTVRPHQVVLPPAKDKALRAKQFEKAKRIAQQGPGFPRFKVAFIPKVSEKQRVTFTRAGDIRISLPEGQHVLIDFDKQLLAEGDFYGVARKAILELARYKGNATIQIQAGHYILRRGGQIMTFVADAWRKNRADYLERLTQKLGSWLASLGDRYPLTDAAHSYIQWMAGLSIFALNEGRDIMEAARVRREQREDSERLLVEARNKRRRRKEYLSSYRLARSMSRTVSTDELVRIIQRFAGKDKRSVHEQAILDSYQEQLKRRYDKGQI